MQTLKLKVTKYSHQHITHGLLQPCRHQSICKICPFGKDNYFSLQMPRNSYLYLNISVENGSKTAEANRENVIAKRLTRTDKLSLDKPTFQFRGDNYTFLKYELRFDLTKFDRPIRRLNCGFEISVYDKLH